MLHNPWMPSDQLMLCDPVDAARPLDATRPMKAARHVDAMETGDTAEIVDIVATCKNEPLKLPLVTSPSSSEQL